MRTQLLGGAWCALLCTLAACNASDSSDASSATRPSTRSSSSASAGSIASDVTLAVAFTDSSPTPAAVKSVNAGAGIAVSGNKFINTATGKPVVLAGANLDGLDGSGGYGGAGQIKQWRIIAGITSAQWGAIAAKWGINAIRLPMNSDYWLNPTVYDDPAATAIETGACCYTSIGNGKYTPDASSAYQSVLTTIVTHITAAGIVVILDLHCDAPKNSSGQYIACVGETSFPSSDTAPTFWSQVANAFKSNAMVIFALFNEPYGSSNYNRAGPPPPAVSGGGNFATPAASAVTMIKGGLYTPFSMLAGDKTLVTLSGGAALEAASMTGLISTIRNTGATNVILVPPIWYSGQIQTWLNSYATADYGRPSAGNPDPLSQLGADWHNYDWSSGPRAPLALLAAGYPICITETYGFDSALDGGRDASGYTWAASNGIGVLVWTWATWDSHRYIPDGAKSPTDMYNYLLNTAPWVNGSAPAPTGNTFGRSPLPPI
jgi:endoglucanase